MCCENQVDRVLIMINRVSYCSLSILRLALGCEFVIVVMVVAVCMRMAMFASADAVEMNMRSTGMLQLLIDRRASMHMRNMCKLRNE
jgi:hypothetical protein